MENGNQIIDKYELYLIDVKRVSQVTKSAYMTDLKKFTNFITDKYLLKSYSELNPSIITSYILHMKNGGQKSSSISRCMSVIKNFTLFLFHEEILLENISNLKIDLPKEKKKLPEVLNIEEIDLLLSQPDSSMLGIRDRAMLETLYTSGLKVNELINLKLSDVNLKLKVLNCSTGTHKRILPLGAIAQEALEAYINLSRIHIVKDECEFLFVSYSGKKMSRQGFWKLVKKYSAQAKIKKNISTSTLRHSFATHMIQNGIHKDTLRETLGNSSVASVQMYLDLNRKRNRL